MRYRHLCDHARSYPELGLDALEPGQEIETEQAVNTPLLESLDAAPEVVAEPVAVPPEAEE